MPIYEYTCDKCGAHVEVLQKIDDKPLTKCRECKGKLRKAVSKSSFAFKGSGWYVTDYARGDKAGKDAPAKDSASASKTEAKPAKKEPKSTTSAD